MKDAWEYIALLLAVSVGFVTLQEENAFDIPLVNETGCGNGTQTSTLRDRGCACDPDCSKYGDCCKDSPFFKPEDQKLGASRFSCRSFASVYLIDKCPHGWVNPIVRYRCEYPDETFRDPLRDAPITSLITNLSYINSYCATCHGDIHSDAIEIWQFKIDCGIVPRFMNVTADQYVQNLAYNSSQSTWYLNVTTDTDDSLWYLDEGYENTCELVPIMSERAAYKGRLCEYVCSDCSESWTNDVVKEKCEAYTSHICIHFETFRNQYCAMCNNISTADRCFKDVMILSDRFGPSLSMVLDWRKMNQAQQCSQTEIYDPFLGLCRAMFDIGKSEENTTEVPGACVNVSLTREEYILAEDNSSAYVPAYNKTYHKDEFVIYDKSLVICLPRYNHNSFAPELGYITVVGLTLSILFLVLHLSVFFMVPKLRNFSSTNLSCLCISLLLLYCSFIASGSATPRTAGCITLAVFIHYSLLASFFWMLAISFDIFRAMKQATSRLVVSHGRQWLRFGLYCMVSWLLPVVIVGTGLAMDSWWPEWSFVPGYGQRACWLNHSNALLVFCVVPLAVVMALNVCFFCWTAYLIHVNSADAASASSTRKEFPLFLRLGFIMGITWIIGVVAALIEVPGLWHLFVIFNTLQGLFIFLAFTCTKKVWKEVRNVIYRRSVLAGRTTTTTESTTDSRSLSMQSRHIQHK